MSEKKLFHRFNVEKVTIEENWKKLPNFQLVRPLTTEQQIDRFQAAGRRLQELEGLGVYDFDSAQPLDDTLEDPTRDPEFDLIDAAVNQRDLELKRQAAEAAGTQAESQGNENNSVTDSNSMQQEISGAPPEAARSDPEA